MENNLLDTVRDMSWNSGSVSPMNQIAPYSAAQ